MRMSVLIGILGEHARGGFRGVANSAPWLCYASLKICVDFPMGMGIHNVVAPIVCVCVCLMCVWCWEFDHRS